MDTYASNIRIGAALPQVQDKEEKVFEYFSSVLSKPEKNYCATRKQLLAIVRAFKRFHIYLYEREFLVIRDHAAPTWLLQKDKWLHGLHDSNSITSRFNTELVSSTIMRTLLRRPCKNCKHCDKIEQRETLFNCGALVEDEEWTTA